MPPHVVFDNEIWVESICQQLAPLTWVNKMDQGFWVVGGAILSLKVGPFSDAF